MIKRRNFGRFAVVLAFSGFLTPHGILAVENDSVFLKRIRARQARIEIEVKDVVYQASAIGQELNEEGQLKKETVTVRKVLVKGIHQQKSEYISLKVDGRELTGKERAKEIDKSRQRSGGRRSDMPFTAAVWSNYEYKVLGRETLDGRSVRLVAFSPVHPKIGSIKGTARVLEETGDIVRLDFQPGLSASVIKKAEFRLDYARYNGYWFPEKFRMELIIKIKALVDLAYVHVKVEERYSDYRINTGLRDEDFK